jgi:hypothetical protein
VGAAPPQKPKCEHSAKIERQMRSIKKRVTMKIFDFRVAVLKRL